MKLTIVGCSPAWPNPGRAHSGYLLEHDGRRLLVDCGPGVLARLREAEHWPEIDAIAITHMHLDHCGDLVAWLWGHLHVPPKGTRGPDLWLPPGGRAELAQLGSRFDEVFTIREYPAAEPFEAAGFTVTPFAVSHYTQPTWGLRIEAGERRVAFSADTGPTDALAELAAGANVFLCEATLDQGEPEPRGHLTAGEAAAAALAARAHRLLLVHRPVELETPPGLELAYDGLELKL
ncbi:MAG TPA: MBL fold metallo-hydrolase [Gaiellaceae bacterium]|nr:MBL fold metallo-hydrolase [Gaiellaceae bacterium]